MIYPIVIYGDEVLRKHCHEIAPDYPGLKQLVEDMFLTLEDGTVTVRHRDSMQQERVKIEALHALVDDECSYRKLFRKLNL